MSDEGPIVVEIEAWVAHLVPRFLENRERDVTEIRQAIADRDFEAIWRIGHTLKGAAAGYGFTELAEVGERLEAAAAEKNLGRAAECGDSLEHYLERVTVVYR